MGLFQTSVLKKYKKLQDKQAVGIAYNKYADYFHNPERQENIRESKEEQFQEGFLRELFVKVFDYTLNPEPQFNLTTELKNEKGAKKADGAILKDGKALAVIELKSTKTKDLESIREQAFGYKVNHSECVYVITSNFEKLRFYINNAVDFEEFNLFTLNEEQFELLYLCLHKENILNNVPLKIKTDSVVAEESITKKFYSDYSQFKKELFRDLVKQNIKNEIFRTELQKEDTDRATKNIKQALFKKSQKLIDRFLFIFFAEDKGLLPPNSTLQILNKWKADWDFGDERPLYDLFKQYFKFLDIGRKGTQSRAEIFAYNGGLFKPDLILDGLVLDDQTLYKHTKTLSDYDFESQVGVNILGHIFENSLNEIESVNAEIEGTDFDKQKTKRKKDGVFYTPKYITKYIVDNTIGKLCAEKKQDLEIKEEEYQKSRKGRKTDTLKKLKTKLDNYRNWLLTLTILDPACGSGAFLNQALDFLIKEHTYIDELETSLLGGGMVMKNIENTILENNIFGVDLNEESVEIAKLSLWLRTAQPRRKLNTLNNNIKCGNSLIDDPKVASNKAFNWQEEFPHIFPKKNKKIWHVTTATHNSRYSQRMFDNNVKTGNAVWLDEEDEIIITKTIAKIVKEDKLNVIEYNICGDHLHLLLVCAKEELTKIVGKIKSMTARATNIAAGRTTTTRGHAPLSASMAIGRGETQTNLWTQKFGKSEIKDEEYLNNAIEYIRNNRIKHELPKSKEIEKIKKEFLCKVEQALKTEYNGGFDVVIGNPPYGMLAYEEQEIFYKKNYKTVEGRLELYELFIEKSISLLKENNILSFITPNTFLSNLYSKKLREFITVNYSLIEITNFGIDVFSDPTVHTCIFFVLKKENSINQKVKIRTQVEDINELQNDFDYTVDTKTLVNNKNKTLDIFISPQEAKIFKKTDKLKRLGDVFYLRQCIKTGNDPVFVKKSKDEKEPWKKSLRGKGIRRYGIVEKDLYLKYGDWLARNWKNTSFYETPKIVVRETGSRIISAIDIENRYLLSSLYSVYPKSKDFSLNYLKFVLTIINSRFATFYIHKIAFGLTKGAFTKVRTNQLARLPLPLFEDYSVFAKKVDLITETTKVLSSKSNQFIAYIANSLNISINTKLQNWHELEFSDFIKELNKAIKKVGSEKLTKKDEMEWMELFEEKKAEAQTLKSEIEKTDKEIDQLVYELYGLTEEEIRIVEEG